MREWGREKPHGLSLWWLAVARGKKSAMLDLRSQKVQELFGDLLRRADVVVENFRSGTLEQRGLGSEVLSALDERVVLTRLHGFGQDGP